MNPWQHRDRKTPEQRYAISARMLGIPFSEYMAHIDAGEAWCIGHKTWEPEAAFKMAADRPGRLESRCAGWRSIEKGAAALGISKGEYQVHVDAGEKWCAGHHRWEPREGFGTRGNRLDNICREHTNTRAAVSMKRLYWQRKQEIAS